MKAKLKFTPGPWRRLPDSGVILARNNEVTICDCDIDSHVDEKIGDMINYLILLEGILKDSQ